MSLNSNYFKLGSVATALYVGTSSLPNYTYNGIAVSDISSNTDYLVIQALGGSSGSQQMILPPAASNYVFIKNATPYQILAGVSSNLNVTIASGEIAALFNDGTQYNKVQIGTLNLNFNNYANTSVLSGSSEFLVQTGSTINNITWSQIQALLGISPGTLLVAGACSTTNITLSGTQTIDGYAAPVGTVVLVNGQLSAIQNGLYVVASGAWTRSAALNTGANASSVCVAVKFGTSNSGLWINQQSFGSDIVDTSSLSWLSASFPASNGVTKLSNGSIVGTDYDYVINSVATLRAATTEGSGSAATTIHLLPGSYLITGNTGIPSGSGPIDISGLTLVIATGAKIQITGTTGYEGFKNGSLVVASGSIVRINDLTWINNNSSNSIITTASSKLSINNCVLQGGTEIVFNGGELFVNDTQFGGNPTITESAVQQIFVNVNTSDSSGSFQGELHCHGCNFLGGVAAINLQNAPTYPLKTLDVQHCRFASSSYSIDVQNDTRDVLIFNNTFIGSTEEIYFYCNTSASQTLANTSVVIKGNSFESSTAPVYVYGGCVPQSLVFEDNILINSAHGVQSNYYDKDSLPIGVLKMRNNVCTSTHAFLPDVIPSMLSAGGATVTSATGQFNRTIDENTVGKSVVGADTLGAPVAGVAHETTTWQQNATAVDNNNVAAGYGHALVINTITTGKFSLAFDVPNNGTSSTSILFKPWQLDTTNNVYMGMMHIFSWPRTTTDTNITPCYARTPFICSYNGGFCIASNNNGSYRLPANDLAVNANWGAHPYTFWWNSDGSPTSPFDKKQMGLGQLDGGGNLLVDLTSTVSSGIPTVTIQLAGLGSSVSGSTNRWVIIQFEYTAIQSDASE